MIISVSIFILYHASFKCKYQCISCACRISKSTQFKFQSYTFIWVFLCFCFFNRTVWEKRKSSLRCLGTGLDNQSLVSMLLHMDPTLPAKPGVLLVDVHNLTERPLTAGRCATHKIPYTTLSCYMSDGAMSWPGTAVASPYSTPPTDKINWVGIRWIAYFLTTLNLEHLFP